jgi:hypothetical protein
MKDQQGIVSDKDLPVLNQLLAGTLNQIGDLSKDWLADARVGKGYWATVLGKASSTPT